MCAHSWHARSYRDVRYLNNWLQKGFAVAASDYQGIGVPGFNPQFNNCSNAYTMLDITRAALGHFKGLNNQVVLVGQSQGGSAVVAAGGYAPQYAPDLKVRAIVGTGIVYTSPNQPPRAPNPERDNIADPTIAYNFYHVLAAQALDPSLDPARIYTERALPLLEQARTSCLAELSADVAGVGLTRANTYKPGYEEVLAKATQRYGDDVQRTFPTVKLKIPLFIGVGEKDALLAPGKLLAQDACAAGSTVEIHVYEEKDHSGAVNQSLQHSLPFVRKALAGEVIAPICIP
ncbi:lipase family protein [Methylobacillus gramineus]|uniref:alpha/beta fold hydrolase n=1 Tax=Methylobacillus gramineus TaxID=755169 RepID=UPI001CFF90E7|nr:alpha/beta fold hydrolase [Methylobacillus gramineus]MCB5184382.1 lipase family protein [Methylobacillus gramineus]